MSLTQVCRSLELSSYLSTSVTKVRLCDRSLRSRSQCMHNQNLCLSLCNLHLTCTLIASLTGLFSLVAVQGILYGLLGNFAPFSLWFEGEFKTALFKLFFGNNIGKMGKLMIKTGQIILRSLCGENKAEQIQSCFLRVVLHVLAMDNSSCKVSLRSNDADCTRQWTFNDKAYTSPHLLG